MSPSGMTNMFTISLLVSKKGKGDQHQQQLQGAFARTHDVGRGSMACFIVVLVRA